MKFRELKERLSKMSGSKLTGQELSVYYRENPLAKKAARDPVLKKAIEFALDHGGAMNYAIKNIEKMKRGISRHPQVQQALQFANESINVQALKDAINEKMSPAEKKKRLEMIRKAVEKLNAKADAQAKKDALAAIKSMESVEESVNELNGQTGPVLRISYKPQRAGGKLTSHSTITKSDLYKDIVYNNKNWKITANTNALAFRLPHAKGREDDRKDFMGLIKSAKGDVSNLIRGGGFTRSEVQELKRNYEKAIDAFKGTNVVSQDHEIYVAHNKPGGLKVKEGLLAMLKTLDEFGMRNHISLSSRDGVLTQIQDAGQYSESVKESAMDTRERKLNIKMKELEYKMKLADFIKDKVEAKLKPKQEKKKLPEAETSELKVSDTSSSTYNKLTKIAKDIGVEISREENHLKIVGDAKKMAEFKSQMSVAMKESVQLQEGMSKQMPISKYAKLIGIDKKEQQWILDNEADMIVFEPNQNKANSFRVLSYPVRDGDYYFAFLTGKSTDPQDKMRDLASKENMRMNLALAQEVKRYAALKGDSDLSGHLWNFMNKKFDKLPRQLGAGDTMTREELASAIEDAVGAPIIWEGTYTPNKPQIAEGILDKIIDKVRRAKDKVKRMRLGRKGKTTIESKKTFKEARFSRTMKRSEILRKFGNEMKGALRKGTLELSTNAEDALINYVMDNYPEEISTDDPDDWIDWLDNNLEDFVKGKGYK